MRPVRARAASAFSLWMSSEATHELRGGRARAMTSVGPQPAGKALHRFGRSRRASRSVLASSHIVKMRPGFRILFGSSARLSARIVSISSDVLLKFRYGRLTMPMPCSAEIDPPNSLVI